ncbi:MAG: ABC transporter permease subunit [Candidatus Micrarchaeia archaeon]
MDKRNFLLFLIALSAAAVYLLGADAFAFPYLAFRTFLRMFGAYALSLAFSLGLGIFIAHNRRAFELVFPILDILQSVPILGFLPIAVIFIIDTIPLVGGEAATVFLIFTSMTWAVIFNVIEGVRSIPGDIRDVARLTKLSGVNYLFQVVFPAIYGPVVSGSITGWGGGWYFLVAGEYIAFGKGPPYILPGIGSFIAQSAYAGDILHSIIGIGVLSAMVLFMNMFVWRPLLSRAARFSYSTTAGSADYVPAQDNLIIRALDAGYNRLKSFSVSFFRKTATNMMNAVAVKPSSYIEQRDSITLYDMLTMGAVLAAFIAVLLASGHDPGYIFTLGFFSGQTLVRILIAYLIATAWTVSFAVFLGRNKKLIEPLMPVFDVAQSVPAISVFPIIVVFVIQALGNDLGVQAASILLILTGMQWYLLFNVIRAVQAIPGELIEVSGLLRLRTAERMWNVMLPAIFPTFILSSIQAIGGGWNATIVSEYIVYKDKVFFAEGLGYLLDDAATKGDLALLMLSVLTMVAIIIFFNKFVWRKALKRAELYKF